MSFYIKVVSGPVDQGDIIYPVRLKDWFSWWPDESEWPIVLMTPACDLANEKADYHRFVVLQPFQLLLYKVGQDASLSPEHWQGIEPLSKGKSNSIKDKLRKAVKNAWPRYHFLPKEEGLFETDKLIDFEVIGTVPLDKVDKNSRVARLASPYKEELIHRFSHHIMRIGTEDFDSKTIEEAVSSCVGLTKLSLTA